MVDLMRWAINRSGMKWTIPKFFILGCYESMYSKTEYQILIDELNSPVCITDYNGDVDWTFSSHHDVEVLQSAVIASHTPSEGFKLCDYESFCVVRNRQFLDIHGAPDITEVVWHLV